MISEPEVYERQLTDDDRVLVMGSDGLWEFIPSRDVIQLIEDCEQPDVRTEESDSNGCRKLWSDCVLFRGIVGMKKRRLWMTQP